MDKKVILLKDISKIYDTGAIKVHALTDVDIDVSPGEFVAVMGSSGSGKTTLMNIISCMDRPSSGEYYLGGKDVSKLDRDQLAGIRNKTVGIVFQSFNLLSRTTALENVELPLLYSGGDFKKRHRKAMDVLGEVGLTDWSHHHPNQLSGGQQQRVAIARAMVNDPAVLLADEPTGNLDSRTSVEIMELFQNLNEKKGITVIIVTHEHDISRYAKRIITFRDGRVVSDEKVNKRLMAKAVLKKKVAKNKAGAQV